ncbi:LysR family transcriptional regulator [Aestuariicella hydrocarbonica]|uniref:LysR family transcriptional regulator n=1 Tax=Pseudomaricurvus hydrocarbonicus TaxID=1470433 RepID=A0A9E5JQG8_9GAMM|nr:LysR family transcriptional regulator [Aestuariicella hydrocarbonica]NHO64604.1 LysR family transcriptional regulator [Aestuariicella hydrocarbonica]
MITLKHLHHLRAIIQHRTILGAAEALHLTQSAMTRSLLALEDSLGVKLFDRAKSGMTPTAFCLQIAESCEDVLLKMDDIQREADIYRNLDGGKLHIAVGRAIGGLIARNTLPEFVARYPKVSVTVSEGTPDDLVFRIKNREVDLLLAGSGSYMDIEGINHQHLKDIPLAVMTSADHPLSQQKNIQLEQLADYPLIAPTTLSQSHPLLTVIAQARNKHEPIPAVICSDFPTLKAIVLQNHSWLLAPELYFTQEIAQGQLCKLDVNNAGLVSTLSVIELQGRSRSPAAQAFIEIFEEYVASIGGG